MPALLALLSKIVTNPVVANLIIPSLSRAFANFFQNQAAKLELKNAVKTARIAKTSEELRVASKRLSDATDRD